MRKNFIGWKRRQCCSICEICCPVAMMFLLVILRGVIDTTDANQLDLLSYRQPTYPAFFYQGTLDDSTDPADNTWSGQESFLPVGLQLNEFMKYSDYPNETYYETATNPFYSFASDTKAPIYFLPTNCLKTNSFQLPAVDMPIIAIVGWNKATAMMQSYLENLIKIQKANVEKFGLSENYPDFYFKNFTSKDDLFSYTSADTYTYTTDGVCYGFSIDQDSTGAWTTDIFMNDQQTFGGPSSINIPNTQKPAYNPL